MEITSHCVVALTWTLKDTLGEEHDWEGVRNGIYCEWTTADGETRFEVFRPGDLVIIEAAPPVSDSQQ